VCQVGNCVLKITVSAFLIVGGGEQSSRGKQDCEEAGSEPRLTMQWFKDVQALCFDGPTL
jgi:hypothetical protein